MPIIKKIETKTDIISITRIEETLEELSEKWLELYGNDEKLKLIKYDTRKKQYLASRILLFNQLSEKNIRYGYSKNKDGKPFLLHSNNSFSISHSGNYVTCIVSENKYCGIDLETKFEQAHRLKSKYCSVHEQRLCINSVLSANLWSSKEAIYKSLENRGLIFERDMVLNQEKFNLNRNNEFLVLEKDKVKVQNITENEFVINICSYL